MRLTESILRKLNENANYFDYLRMTGKPDNRYNFYDYLVNVEGWSKDEASSYVSLNWEKYGDEQDEDDNKEENKIDESYQMGTMTEEQYDSICERLGLAYSNASGGINRFSGADISIIKDFLSEGLLDPNDAQNNAPSIKEIIDFSEKEGISDFKVGGYVVVPSRDDSRISIDDVEFNFEDSLQDEVEKFLEIADEKSIENNHASAWWD